MQDSPNGKPSHKRTALLLAATYLVIVLAYTSQVASDVAAGNTLLIGFFLLFAGYAILAANYAAKSISSGPEPSSEDKVQGIAYGLLAIFFVGSYFTKLTYHTQPYDILAAAGLSLLAFSYLLAPQQKGIKNLGAALLGAYYALSSVHYFGKAMTPTVFSIGAARAILAAYQAHTTVDYLQHKTVGPETPPAAVSQRRISKTSDPEPYDA